MRNLRKIITLFTVFSLVGTPLFASEAGEKVIFYHHDHLGSVIMATDEDGHVEWKREFEAYGKPIYNGDKAVAGFTGHEYVAESELNYMKARWYEPELGRFLSPDPVFYQPGNPTSFNRYAYANNSPYSNVDPDGRQAGLALGNEITLWLLTNPSARAATPALGARMGTAAIASQLDSPAPGPADVAAIAIASYAISGFVVDVLFNEKADDAEGPALEGVPEFDFDDPEKPPVGEDGEEWEWRGQLPAGSAKGAWKNPNGPESIHPDLDHSEPVGPHWDFNDRKGPGWRIDRDGNATPK